ncbi:MAG TPA: haloacid dehalogenase type II [Thermomicrobiaceae bacterium]|nr:haloacid dehalogenase type II [Thermomicrobiaceae bacterium]
MALDLGSYDVLTFDCYGTLIDWESGILTALRPLLARHDVALSDEQVLERFAALESRAELPPYRPYREVLARVVDGFGRELGFAPTPAERAALAESVASWPAFPDTAAALQALARHDKLAILSNVDDDLFAGSARRLGVEFAAVVTAQQVGSYKPDPRNFARLIARIGVPRERILHVAQSLFHDIAPARDAGLATVWVNRRHDRRGPGATPAASAEPDLEVPDLATLARLVDAARPAGTR